MKSAGVLTIVAFFVAMTCAPLRAGDNPRPAKLAVPVRLLLPAQPKPNAAPSARPNRPARMAEEPLGVPPQYQTKRRSLVKAAAKPDDPAVRFLVPLPERPVLIEARITVDGQPFGAMRERRIDQLLAELAKPAPPDPIATPPEEAPAAPTEAIDASSIAETQGIEAPPETPEPDARPPRDNSLLGRLKRYAAAAEHAPDRGELHWLLENWADGPTLLTLHESFQRVRANESPLFAALDRDDDGSLSPEEISAARETLLKYDRNQDDLLTLDEITAAAAASAARQRLPSASDAAPVIPLDELPEGRTLERLLERYAGQDGSATSAVSQRFDADGDGRLNAAELAQLRGAEPDLRVEVHFDTGDTTRSRLEIVAIDPSLDAKSPTIRQTSITLEIAGALLELSAVQSQRGLKTDQVSLGAIRDGYPLFPEIDQDEDGRLTIRELRRLSQRVKAFDRDGDGGVSAREVLPTIRLAFGHGATAHLPLVVVRSVHPPAAANAKAPDWFVRMDRNRDGDLTRREFLGTQQQFAEWDADGDGLISIGEAGRKK